MAKTSGSPMRYALRPARIDDLEAMMVIGHEGLRPSVEAVRGWNSEEEARSFREHFIPELCSIILVDGDEVGYIKLEPRSDHLYLDGIYLARAYRGRGLGTQILSAVIAKAQRDGQRIRLRILKPNPARRLYERLGFREIDEGSDHVYMEV